MLEVRSSLGATAVIPTLQGSARMCLRISPLKHDDGYDVSVSAAPREDGDLRCEPGRGDTDVYDDTSGEPRFVAEKANPSYHPGRCAKVYLGERCLGVLGQIHPSVAAGYGVDAELYCAELSFDALFESKGGIPVFKPLPRFPAVTRDIAVVCDSAIPVGELRDCILRSGGKYLVGCVVFDVYAGRHIAEGMKSVAFSLSMRAEDQTLTDEHAEETVRRVLDALSAEFGAVIR